MQRLTQASWDDYVERLSKLSKKAGELMREYIDQHGTNDPEGLIAYANALVTKYGEGSAELAAQMYDAIAVLQGAAIAAAEPAAIVEYGTVAKAVNGLIDNPEQIQHAVERLVKLAAADTTLKNAKRDGAEFAWIPHGDTCAFCITLASNGWQKASKAALKGGHAEHIHANCDCEYAIRFNSDMEVSGYDSERYRTQYYEAGGLNGLRRVQYAKNKDRINAQKRAAYAARNTAKGLKKAENTATIYLDDVQILVGVGAKAKTVYVKLPDGSSAELTQGTRVTNVQTIAGNGRNREIDVVDALIEKYPGSKAELWIKQKGFGYINFEGECYKAELHWYAEETIGRVEWKLKPMPGGNWFYDEDE